MAHWTITGTGIEGDAEGKTFGVKLDTSKDTWLALGSSVDTFFNTKSGIFKIAGIPELGTQIVSAAKKEVAFFTGLNGASAVGSTGRGRASEKGVDFKWKLDSK